MRASKDGEGSGLEYASRLRQGYAVAGPSTFDSRLRLSPPWQAGGHGPPAGGCPYTRDRVRGQSMHRNMATCVFAVS